MKTIKCKPVESICIQLADGKEYVCTFNMLSAAYFNEEISKLGDIKLEEVSPARYCSLILYSGIKANDEGFSMEDAIALAMAMEPGHYGEIIKLYNDAMFDSLGDTEKELAKKIYAQYLSRVAK